MIYVGVDYSLRSPGICIVNNDKIEFHYLSEKIKLTGEVYNKYGCSIIGHLYPIWENDQDRHNKLAKWVLSLIPNNANVAIEGYAFASVSSRLFQIGENTGCLKQMLWENNIKFDIFQPTEVKKYATGKGNAKKEDMVTEFTNLEFDIIEILNKNRKIVSPISDLVDAYFIAKLLIHRNINT